MILDLGKGPNQKTRKYAYLRISCAFWFEHFPRSGIKSESSFLKKVLYNYCSKQKFWRVLFQKVAFQKMDFPLYF